MTVIALIFGIGGGVGYNSFSGKKEKETIVESGGKQVNVYHARPDEIPIGGCGIYRLKTETFWSKQ